MKNNTYRDERSSRVQALLPVAGATFVFGVSFGVVATESGFGLAAAVVMSATTFGGAAQVAAVSVLGGGGGAHGAVLAGALLNARYLPMGVAASDSYRGSWWKRGAQAQLMGDETWALSRTPDGRHDARMLVRTGAVVYVVWLTGTALGVLAFASVDAGDWGLDMVSPTLFLALLWRQLETQLHRGAALAAATVCLLLTPVAPVGLPILAASLVCVVGVFR